MKLMVIGHARHGKDTVCSLLHDMYGLRHISSSFFVAERCVRPALAEQGLQYETLEACYDDRVNHRDKWFNAIADYNSIDPARLGRELLTEYDIYCGLRNIREYQALVKEKAFDLCWWIDRSNLVGPEDKSSNTLHSGLADEIINNNHDMDYLINEVRRAFHSACVITGNPLSG